MRILRSLLVPLVLLAGLLAAAPASARTVWLCKPGIAANPCVSGLTTTSVFANGTKATLAPSIVRGPKPIDCFYVYPTVSGQPTPNADRSIDPELRGIAGVQAARFSGTCRMFAPVYRQVTLKALFSGGFTAERLAIGYRDVRAAWRDYLRSHNGGRGVVLIGHSQGTGMLTRLVREEIDPRRSARRRLVSALLLGGDVAVRRGSDRGGDFRNVRACRSARQLGCVIAYSAFSHKPPDLSLFGRVSERYGGPGDRRKLEVLCTNPAALGGGSGPLRPLFTDASGWNTYPKLYSARCRRAAGASWLQVDDIARKSDVRPRVTESLGPAWGLHLHDVNIALGNLTDVVARQAVAYRKARR